MLYLTLELSDYHDLEPNTSPAWSKQSSSVTGVQTYEALGQEFTHTLHGSEHICEEIRRAGISALEGKIFACGDRRPLMALLLDSLPNVTMIDAHVPQSDPVLGAVLRRALEKQRASEEAEENSTALRVDSVLLYIWMMSGQFYLDVLRLTEVDFMGALKLLQEQGAERECSNIRHLTMVQHDKLYCGTEPEGTVEDFEAGDKGPFLGTYQMRGRDPDDTNRKYSSELEGKGPWPGGNQNWVTCDEFPFNSWDEGGSWGKPSRECAPGYQQHIQGVINTLPSNVWQEVTWINSKGETDKEKHAWKEDWWGKDTVGDAGAVHKDIHWNWALNNKKSLTMHLFNSETDSTPSGTKYQVFNHDIVAGNGVDETNIANAIAAINLVGNPKYEIDYNAYCWKPTVKPRSHNGWGPFVRA
ncbi:hypothetical protein BJX63DRAFT_431934 [Aspergillus granulosus]|uniref:Uncharacterized protein n=1 Tax=Aspergillus granulosus TaxID=176169 RepID=A0ABR4HDN4_9EURO